MTARRMTTAALLTVDALTLVVTHAAPTRLWTDLHAAPGSPTVDRLAGDLAATGLFIAALWLAVGLAAAAVAAAPGVTGRIARQVSRALLPAAVQRIVAGTAGLGVLLAPVTAGAVTSGSPTPRPTTSTSTPVWPTGASITPRHTPPRHTPPHPAHGTAAVTVAGGDSLWLFAARRLGTHATDAQIARTWPQIYTANRNVIGDDPSLIRPGQHLTVPATSVQEQS